jgi:hypothetical protein
MLNIKRTDKVSNESVYQLTGQVPLVRQIQQRQLRFIGHCLRREPKELVNQYALYTPKETHGKRKRGRPKMSYADYLAKLINNVTPPTVQEIRNMASNREDWAKIVVACRPTSFAAD